MTSIENLESYEHHAFYMVQCIISLKAATASSWSIRLLWLHKLARFSTGANHYLIGLFNSASLAPFNESVGNPTTSDFTSNLIGNIILRIIGSPDLLRNNKITDVSRSLEQYTPLPVLRSLSKSLYNYSFNLIQSQQCYVIHLIH